jgi:hypothetical protein
MGQITVHGIDIAANVVLSVLQRSSQYLVASQVLCTNSPVFRTILGGNSSFGEAVVLRAPIAEKESLPN